MPVGSRLVQVQGFQPCGALSWFVKIETANDEEERLRQMRLSIQQQ